ncbi:MAG: glycoside hydrolase family 15 protein [Chitinophagales bacterium]
MRNIVLGNGTMMVNFDKDLNLRDLYWPYGGFENHGDGNRTNFGVFCDDQFSWIFSSEWTKEFAYLEDTPITDITATNNQLGLEIRINDAIHWAEDFYLKTISIRNDRNYTREIKLMFYQDFSINGIEAGDSAVYDPRTGGVCHFKKGCYILVNGMNSQGELGEYSTGVKRYQGKEGTFRDAEDGTLACNPIADGPVDSAIGMRVRLEPGAQERVYYWLIVGHRFDDCRTINQRFLSRRPDDVMQDMIRHYRAWIKRTHSYLSNLTPEQAALFKTSLFTIKSQLDRKGAVVASPDADTFLVARDHYMYLWPRDGAMVAHALDLAGYPEESRRIYMFCSHATGDEGYFLQRYNTDGSPGCTWHPMILDGKEIPPIQEDETALVIWALGKHFKIYRDEDLICKVYENMVKPALEFMISYIDPDTGLIKPSWDLWEERRGVFAFTCGAVFGALEQGMEMAELMGDYILAEKCKLTSGLLKAAMANRLYLPGIGRFVRGLYEDHNGSWMPDLTLDASLYGIFGFGAFSSLDERVENTMAAVEDGLWVKTGVEGAARYTNDYYHRVSDDLGHVPGNPWILTTLWLADWYLTREPGKENLSRAAEIMDWAVNHTSPGGLLPEQVHPYTGEPISVCPLTWAHSTFIKVAMDYLKSIQSGLTH